MEYNVGLVARMSFREKRKPRIEKSGFVVKP
jgi:hypothetical protein